MNEAIKNSAKIVKHWRKTVVLPIQVFSQSNAVEIQSKHKHKNSFLSDRPDSKIVTAFQTISHSLL